MDSWLKGAEMARSGRGLVESKNNNDYIPTVFLIRPVYIVLLDFL